MAIMFAEASISENGGINGVKGDQANEIRLSNPYTHKLGWRTFRHPNAGISKWIGINGRVCAQNANFGYGQSDRVSGYTASKNAGWEPAKVTTPCNLDCSEMVRTCIACAMEKDIADFNTASEPSVLLALGFKEVTDGSMNHGDIKCTPSQGHTVIVTDTSITSSTATASASVSYYPAYTGASGSIAEAMNSMGIDGSYSHRVKVAAANGISGYAGTAAQNTQMLNLLKQGKLVKA